MESLSRTGGVLVVVLAMTLAAYWPLRRLRQRLPLFLTRRAMGGQATHPDPAFRRVVELLLLPLTLALWLAAAWAITEQSATLHQARGVLVGALHMALMTPLFAVEDRSYSLLDVLALPALLGLLWVVMGAVTRMIQSRILGTVGVERGTQETVATLLRLGGTVLGALVVFQAWGIDVRALALVASVLGVGVGFGLQHLANNLVSGLVIGLERPVKPGDFVSIGGLQGTVERIGARSVEIITADHVSILVPNSHFLEQEVVNWSHRDPTCRIHVPVGVAYGSDVRVVRAALLDAASRHPDVLADPRPSVAFQGFGDSALLFELRVWTRTPSRQRALTSDLNYRIEAALRRHRLTVPFAQRDVSLRSPELSAIALAVAGRHLDDDELAIARAALRPGPALPDDGIDEVTTRSERKSWNDREIAAVVTDLRGPSGLEIADRRHRFTVYPRAFVGREAVDWLVRREGLTRDEAVRLGRLLVERGVIHHVLDEHSFRDAELFYRFCADESGQATVRRG